LLIAKFFSIYPYLYPMDGRADIIARLQREIMPLQGYKPQQHHMLADTESPLAKAFPGQRFPLGAVHEYLSQSQEDLTATSGFIAGTLASHMHKSGATIWICREQKVFPPALVFFGLRPEQFIFVELKQEKDRLWVMEEALKCNGINAVIGEFRSLDFKSSRRLQLAVERSGVTGFVIREEARNTSALLSRWKVHSLPSHNEEGMPGIGNPVWHAELLKVRNGKPMSWQLEWKEGRFSAIEQVEKLPILERKTG
jgi:protein ImuA